MNLFIFAIRIILDLFCQELSVPAKLYPNVILQNRIIPDLLQMLLSNGMCLMGSLGLFLKILYCNYNFTNMYFEHM